MGSTEDDSAAPAAAARGVAIIMDGNGRWAQRRGISVTEGHREGGRALRRTVEAALDQGIRQLTVFAFSTENWQREPVEVAGIMQLFDELLESEAPELNEQGVRMRFIGRLDEVAPSLIDRMNWARDLTKSNTRMDLVIAFNYGGRAEVVDAANRALARARAGTGVDGGEAVTRLDERDIAANLYDTELADPDLIIRTAGEQRISNFLLWQSAYSELIFTDTLWPDFGAEQLSAALAEYASRERRFGGRSTDTSMAGSR